MVKKELSKPGCDCLEMLLLDILKSRILSTMMSLSLFHQQPGDDKDNFCNFYRRDVVGAASSA